MSRASPISVLSTTSTATGPSLTICWAASIAAPKSGEMANAQRTVPRLGRQLQLDATRESERAFGSAKQSREIDRLVRWQQRIDQIAADASRNPGERGADVVGLARAERYEIAEQSFCVPSPHDAWQGERVRARGGRLRRNSRPSLTTTLSPRAGEGEIAPNLACAPSAKVASIAMTLSRMMP